MPRRLLCAALMTIALPALAETVRPLRLAELSADLYARGLASGDAVLILTAASLRKSLELRPEGEQPLPLDWQAMLAAAEPLAAGDAALQGLIADIRAEVPKGVAAGPVYRIAGIAPGTEAQIEELSFRGGAYAEVYVEAASGANLDLTVRDGDGRLICADTDPGPIAYCGWTPAADGVFLLTIANRGQSATDYALMTN